MNEGGGSEAPHDKALGSLLRDLSQQTATLVRQEIELAKAEVREQVKKAALGGGMFVGAAVMGLATLGALTALLIIVLSLVLPAWLAALIVTVIYAAVAAGFAMQGRAKMRQAAPPVPEQTMETIKEDVQWVKDRKRSADR
jgi:uncharacterized membrane protein YqjE